MKFETTIKNLTNSIKSTFVAMSLAAIEDFSENKAKSCIICKKDKTFIFQIIDIDDRNAPMSFSWLKESKMYFMTSSIRNLVNHLEEFDKSYGTSYYPQYNLSLERDDFSFYDLDSLIISQMLERNKAEVYDFIGKLAHRLIEDALSSEEYITSKKFLESIN